MEGVQVLDTVQFTQEKAKERWQEYCRIIKTHPSDHAKTLKKAYYALSKGHQIIDIYQAFKEAGKYDNDFPKLAISRADEYKVIFDRRRRGAGAFWAESTYRNTPNPQVALPENTFTGWEPEKWPERNRWTTSNGKEVVSYVDTVSSLVPTIPPEFYPEGQLQRYFILWEVEEDGWEPVPEPPGDPMLLRRISGNLFVVLAAWDLSPLEKAVIRGALM